MTTVLVVIACIVLGGFCALGGVLLERMRAAPHPDEPVGICVLTLTNHTSHVLAHHPYDVWRALNERRPGGNRAGEEWATFTNHRGEGVRVRVEEVVSVIERWPR